MSSSKSTRSNQVSPIKEKNKITLEDLNQEQSVEINEGFVIDKANVPEANTIDRSTNEGASKKKSKRKAIKKEENSDAEKTNLESGEGALQTIADSSAKGDGHTEKKKKAKKKVAADSYEGVEIEPKKDTQGQNSEVTKKKVIKKPDVEIDILSLDGSKPQKQSVNTLENPKDRKNSPNKIFEANNNTENKVQSPTKSKKEIQSEATKLNSKETPSSKKIDINKMGTVVLNNEKQDIKLGQKSEKVSENKPTEKNISKSPQQIKSNVKNISEYESKISKVNTSEVVATPKDAAERINYLKQQHANLFNKAKNRTDSSFNDRDPESKTHTQNIDKEAKIRSENDKRAESLATARRIQLQENTQKNIVEEKKSLNKKAKIEPESARENRILEGLTPTINKRVRSPDLPLQSVRKDNLNETIDDKRMNFQKCPSKQGEKTRVKSFDAGKTEKINPNDSFETRSRMWEIRKKEKLIHEEKKHLRKQIEECTFIPSVNKKLQAKANIVGDFLQRNAEWTEKVKVNIQNKTDKIFEETMKPEVIKNRFKSAVSGYYQDSRSSRLHEVHRAPNSSSMKAINFELLSLEPAGVQENLNEKITEIRDIFDNISSTLKNKTIKSTPKVDEVQKIVRPNTNDGNKKEQTYSYQTKPLVTKVVAPALTEDVDRIASLKGILNVQKKREHLMSASSKRRDKDSEVYLTEADNARDILKNSTKHLEIRNNRYVMVDTNISAIERRGAESNDISLNFETA